MSEQMKNVIWRRFKKNKMALSGGCVILSVFVVGILAPIISPYDPYSIVSTPLQPPSWTYPFGTDTLGRDVLSRTIWGSMYALLVGVGASTISAAIGVLVGVLGYFRRIIDNLAMRFTDIFLVIPAFFVYLLIVSTLRDRSPFIIMAVLGLFTWPRTARIVRGEFLSLRESVYVKAAKVVGAGDIRIIFRHLLPNAMAPIIVTWSMNIAAAIVTAAGLDFLGVGDPTVISWGNQIASGRIVLASGWWLTLFPGIALIVTIVAFNLLADGMRDVLDPRLS